MLLNDWNKVEVNRAENTWGHTLKQYSLDMFDFLISTEIGQSKTFLDLGCGFGRFYEYIEDKVPELNYIGYDSSPSMLDRIRERFPELEIRTFLRNITAPISHRQNSVLCSAVMIHISEQDQVKVLNNIKDINPQLFTFDTNYQPSLQKTFVERYIKLTESNFRMSWQSTSTMQTLLCSIFGNAYSISFKHYNLSPGRLKAVHFLRRNS